MLELLRARRLLLLATSIGSTVVIGLLLSCAIVLQKGRADARSAADQASLNIVRSIQLEIARTLDTLDLSLQGTIAASQEKALGALSGKARQFFLFDNALKAKFVNAIILIDETGTIVEDSTSLSPRQGNFADREYFLRHKDTADLGLYVTNPFRSRLANGQWVVAISRRIGKPDGSFGGVAVGVIQVAYFQSLLDHLSLGARSSVSLVHRSGILISRRPTLYEVGSDFSNSNLFEHYPTASAGVFEAAAKSDGVVRRFTFQEVPGLPMVVVTGAALDDLYASWRNEALRVVALTLVMVGAMLALAILLSREFRRRRRSDARLRESEARYRLLADHSSDAIILRDAQAVRTYASPAFFRMIGRSPAELGSRSILDDLDEDGRISTRLAFERVRRGESPVITGFAYRRPDGRGMWLEAISNGIFDDCGVLQEVVTNLRDSTERKRAEDELAAVATTDGLTCLGNRHAFQERMTLEWKRAMRHKSELCVLMIDADFFKQFNDRFGHLAGDDALKQVARAIRNNLRRPADFGARYGGEEFLAILPETDSAGGLKVAETIRNAVVALTSEAHLPTSVTVSIGLATACPYVGQDWSDLVASADAALYRAKKSGRNRCVVAHPATDERLSA